MSKKTRSTSPSDTKPVPPRDSRSSGPSADGDGTIHEPIRPHDHAGDHGGDLVGRDGEDDREDHGDIRDTAEGSIPNSGRPSRTRGATAPGTLTLAATPIGNLGDVSARLQAALAEADIVACEDTRVTAKLLAALGIRSKLEAYHDHNADRARPRLLAALARGERVTLVSDAGTPLVSDPGYKLVRACLDAGHPVTAVPGASAVTTALVLSGLPPDRYYFGGFLPTKAGERGRALASVAALPATLLFFEAPRRLASTLSQAAEILGDRPAAVARELTKRFEEVRRDRLSALAAHYAAEGPPLGEVVLVIGPPDPHAAAASAEVDLEATLRDALSAGSLRDAVRMVTEATGLPRSTVYARAVALKNDPAASRTDEGGSEGGSEGDGEDDG